MCTKELQNNIRVLFITNIPSPYNVDYLNELGKLCDVTAVFEQRISTERDSSWKVFNVENFECVILKGFQVKTDMSISFRVIKYIRTFTNNMDRIIIGNPASPTGIIAINYCKLCNIPFILQSEGGFVGSGKGLKEKFKKSLMSGAKLYLSGMNSDKDYFFAYGGSKETIYSYPFTSYFQREILTRVPARQEKESAALELGLEGNFRIIYVGSISFQKGVDVLLKAFKGIDEKAHLYILGGQVTLEMKRIMDDLKLKNVHYVGFAGKEKVRKYYLGCDLFVLPTRGDTWGLVINEAMSHGLPVITTKRCVAGKELIENYKNGFLIESEDYNDLHNRIEELINNKSMMDDMAKNNIDKIQPYSLENMAKVIYSAIK